MSPRLPVACVRSIVIDCVVSPSSEITQLKINFVKNCPQWGLNPLLPDHQAHALPTELGRNLVEISQVSFLLFHEPLHILDFVYFPDKTLLIPLANKIAVKRCFVVPDNVHMQIYV